jgi:excisionase family DNA binding protein
MGEQPLLVSVREGAHYVGIGRDSAYQLVHSGVWPSVRIGRRLLIPRAALERWVQEVARGNGGRVKD